MHFETLLARIDRFERLTWAEKLTVLIHCIKEVQEMKEQTITNYVRAVRLWKRVMPMLKGKEDYEIRLRVKKLAAAISDLEPREFVFFSRSVTILELISRPGSLDFTTVNMLYDA